MGDYKNNTARDWLCDLSETQRSSCITQKAMMLVARQLGDIVHIGKVMGFPQAKIQQYQCNSQHSVSSQISSMFFDWRAKMGSAATVETFFELLKEAEVDETMAMDVIKREYSGGMVNGVLHLQ